MIHNLVSHYGETADMVQCTLAEEIESPCDIIPPQSLDQDSPLPTAEVAKISPKTILPLWQVEKTRCSQIIDSIFMNKMSQFFCLTLEEKKL